VSRLYDWNDAADEIYARQQTVGKQRLFDPVTPADVLELAIWLHAGAEDLAEVTATPGVIETPEDDESPPEAPPSADETMLEPIWRTRNGEREFLFYSMTISEPSWLTSRAKMSQPDHLVLLYRAG
jgi:hypothetical protein